GKIDGEVVVQEKELNLKISNKVLKILRDKGYNVIATRTTDVYVGLTTRADIANSANADLFVSIHNNSFEDSSAKGTLTMYAYDDPKEDMNISGKTIAKIMQKELVKGTGGYDRGLLKNPQIVVIRRTQMPAILVECLFMSNEEDMKKLMDEERLDKIAAGIAQGIENIYDKMLAVDKTSSN
ncbi:MAG: N-acetylmuramoyl-L-alanine amidase, partial [Clostridia bacterium]|nr:N-acetylmuramoyl-L-alanine amidase [Clostridia bacterium]